MSYPITFTFSINFARSLKNLLRISSKATMETIKVNAARSEEILRELKTEFSSLNEQYNNILAKKIREENAKLCLAVEAARNKLIQLEIRNGVQQIPVPNRRITTEPPAETLTKDVSETITRGGEEKTLPEKEKPKKEKKPKETKQKESKPKAPESEPPVDIGRLDLRIAKVEDVKRHPDADTLYVLNINCGEDKPRTVCSGLVKHIPIEDLRDRHVVLLCNLKPAKMRGIMSEAMVMCASTGDKVEVLIPPAGCEPGEAVHCDGYTRQPDPVMNPKKKIFETVAPDLHTDGDLQACFKGVPLSVPGKGYVLAKTLKNVPVK